MVNNDLISREALLKELRDWARSLDSLSENVLMAAIECTCEQIEEFPAVDAEPVRHGKWIENGDDDMDAGMWHCSECGHEIYSDLALIEEMQEQGYALFCEHCGAKMDEEEP